MNQPAQRSLFDPANDPPIVADAPSKQLRSQRGVALDESDEQRCHRVAAYARQSPRFVDNVLLGTAGWTDPTLIDSGHFYPPNANNPELRLRHYAKQFAMVEVDASYYALPTVGMVHKWIDRTPAEFVFDVKAFSLLTGHMVEVDRLPRELRNALAKPPGTTLAAAEVPAEITEACFSMFLQAIAPLREENRLGSVLLQFPPWMEATKNNATKIEQIRGRLSEVQVSVEFRHRSWGETPRFERVLRWLRELKATYVCVDEPQGFSNSMPSHVGVADSRLAVVRFHGRKADVWNRSVSVQEKFNYLYTREELRPWASAIKEVSHHAEVVHAVFNNCRSDYAVIGAKDMTAELLELG